MLDQNTATEFYRRAMEIRRIAEGIYDKAERRTLLKFVADSEKMAAGTLPRRATRTSSSRAAGVSP